MAAADNLKVIEQMYQAFGTGDVDAFLAHVAEDVEWTFPNVPHHPASGIRHGHAGVGEFLQALMESEQIEQMEPREWIADDNSVVVIGFASGTARATGRAFAGEYVHFFKLREGKVVLFKDYPDTYSLAEAVRPE